MSDTVVLVHHHLAHFKTLGVGDAVLQRRYASGCSMANCRGGCCRGGVDVDLEERARILEHLDVIRGLMDAQQDSDPDHWFGAPFGDPDFPSGRAVSTTVQRGTCVFSDARGLCVLHKAEALQPPGTALKPFYCRAYPLCIEEGVLVLDDKPCPGQTGCCGAADGGDLTIFDVCRDELEHVLGAAGVGELRALASTNNRGSP